MTRRTAAVALLVLAALLGCAAAARPTAAAPKGGPAPKPADPCASFGCLNGSKCVTTGKNKTPSCKCHPGTGGTKCETVAAGNFFDVAAVKVKPCPVNNYCPGTGAPVPCPTPGSFTTGAMKKQLSDCKVKPGYWCPSYPNGVCAPAPCPSGSYCPGKPAVNDLTNNNLKPCPTCACTGAECFASSPLMSTEATQCTCPTCSDALKNQGETDVDCGGPNCGQCANGKACLVDGDCVVGSVCTNGLCAVPPPPPPPPAPTCSDNIQNQLETDVDCGGPNCGATCLVNQKCAADGDCSSGLVCSSGGVCAVPPPTPSCGDGIKNQDETDIDCGGLACGATCAVGKVCAANGDCVSGSCIGNVCA